MSTAKPLFSRILGAASAALLATACAASLPPLATVDHVDLERFMGDWYVIASIPTAIETEAYNAVESYTLQDDGTIDTVFTFRKGSFEGKAKRYNPVGFVINTQSNAEWGMRFIWPIKADYRVIYLDPDYQVTIIGRNKRDYVWLMAREPAIAPAELDALLKRIGEAGYDTSKIRQVPQQW